MGYDSFFFFFFEDLKRIKFKFYTAMLLGAHYRGLFRGSVGRWGLGGGRGGSLYARVQRYEISSLFLCCFCPYSFFFFF